MPTPASSPAALRRLRRSVGRWRRLVQALSLSELVEVARVLREPRAVRLVQLSLGMTPLSWRRSTVCRSPRTVRVASMAFQQVLAGALAFAGHLVSVSAPGPVPPVSQIGTPLSQKKIAEM